MKFKYFKCQSIDEMFSFVLNLYKDICDFFSSGKKSRSDVIDGILAYMQANYANA
jgi:hypothetical protein